MAIIDKAVIDNFDRCHAALDCSGDAVFIVGCICRPKISPKLDGHLAFHAGATIKRMRTLAAFVKDRAGINAAAARLVDLEIFLHHFGGAAYLVAAHGAQARMDEAQIERILHLIRLLSITRRTARRKVIKLALFKPHDAIDFNGLINFIGSHNHSFF